MKIDPLAAYGAALSTAVFLWTVWRTRRKVVVQVIPTYRGGDAGFGYTAVVSNHSAVPVHVIYVSMHYAWRKVSLLGRLSDAWRYRAFRWRGWCSVSLPAGTDEVQPFTLAPGQSQNVYIPEAGLIETIGEDRPRFGVYITDGLLKRHYSRPTEPMPAPKESA